ncbi:MAG: ATP-binding protein [Capsulimonas sp.]|uniref:sensor histidine kinase n=2 Tax=Capsulimonas sp. TaxID=2494211 RepID=UPI00326363C2
MISRMPREILIIDDTPEDRAILRRYLQLETEYVNTFIEAENGEEGLQRYLEHAPDCVLLDYQMPDMDGVELLEALREASPFGIFPIVLLTGISSQSVALTAMKLGAQDYLIKGQAGPEEVSRAVRNAMDRTSMLTILDEQRRSLEAKNAELERRNAELDQFAYVASHDLKAPLRGIATIANWIQEDLGTQLTPEIANQLRRLSGRVSRMEGLIDGLLQYARVGRIVVQPERVDTGALVRETIDLLSAPPEFQFAIASGMPTFLTERLRLQQVFLNLIGNGVKHHHRPDGRITIGWEDLGTMSQFSVSDDGPGIEPQYHEKIFTIFQTLLARDKMENTGIGLSLVKKIVEEQWGRVTVESSPGEGTTFRFTWPKSPRKETHANVE